MNRHYNLQGYIANEPELRLDVLCSMYPDIARDFFAEYNPHILWLQPSYYSPFHIDNIRFEAQFFDVKGNELKMTDGTTLGASVPTRLRKPFPNKYYVQPAMKRDRRICKYGIPYLFFIEEELDEIASINMTWVGMGGKELSIHQTEAHLLTRLFRHQISKDLRDYFVHIRDAAFHLMDDRTPKCYKQFSGIPSELVRIFYNSDWEPQEGEVLIGDAAYTLGCKVQEILSGERRILSLDKIPEDNTNLVVYLGHEAFTFANQGEQG